MVPPLFEGGSSSLMLFTNHMQKARLRKSHMVSYGGHTVSSVSCSTVLSEVIFLLEVIQLGHNSEKVLGFGPLHFDPRGHFDFFFSDYMVSGGP